MAVRIREGIHRQPGVVAVGNPQAIRAIVYATFSAAHRSMAHSHAVRADGNLRITVI